MFKPYYIVSTSIIDPIYTLEQIACILLIILIGLLAFLDLKKRNKIIITAISAIIIIIHYTILYKVSLFEKLSVLPLLFMEQNTHGASLGLDYGQILAILNILLWRREIASKIKHSTITYKNSSQ